MATLERSYSSEEERSEEEQEEHSEDEEDGEVLTKNPSLIHTKIDRPENEVHKKSVSLNKEEHSKNLNQQSEMGHEGKAVISPEKKSGNDKDTQMQNVKLNIPIETGFYYPPVSMMKDDTHYAGNQSEGIEVENRKISNQTKLPIEDEDDEDDDLFDVVDIVDGKIKITRERPEHSISPPMIKGDELKGEQSILGLQESFGIPSLGASQLSQGLDLQVQQNEHMNYTQIYPSNTLDFQSTSEINIPTESAEFKKQEYLKKTDLLPYLKMIPNVGYLNDFLRNESVVLQQFGNRTINFGDPFFQLVQNYYQSLLGLYYERQMIIKLKSEIQSLFHKLYQFRTVSYPCPVAYCEDNNPVKGSVTGTIATIIPQNVSSMMNILTKLRHGFYKNVISIVFESSVYCRKIEQYLDSIYSDECLESCDISTPIAVREYEQSTQDKFLIEKMKNCIAILFHFEQNTHLKSMDSEKYGESSEITQFRDNIRKWIRQLIAYLLRIATVDEHRFIIFEIIRCRYSGEWASDLIQLTHMSNDASIDFFIAVLSVFLTPIFESPKNGANTLNNKTEQQIEDSKEGKGYTLLEEDYLQIWQQFPFFEVVDYIFVRSKEYPVSKFFEWDTSFAVLDTILYILQQSLNVFNIPTHRQFARQIGQTIVRYVQIVTSILQNKGDFFEERINQMYNSFFLKSFFSIFRSPYHELGLWSFLGEMPYESISDLSCSAIFWSCFTNSSEINVEYEKLANFETCIKLLDDDPSLRKRFLDLMSSGEQSIFLVSVFAKLAQSHSFPIASIIVHELFILGFIEQTTRATYYKDAIIALGQIIEYHPQMVSMVLRLVIRYMSYVGKTSISLAKVMPLQFWTPAEHDISTIISMLKKEMDSPDFALGTFILSRMGWSDDPILVAVAPKEQRQLSIGLIEALSIQKANVSGLFSRKGDYNKFSALCTDIILRMKFHNDDGTPLLDITQQNHPSLHTLIKNTKDAQSRNIEFDMASAYLLFSLSNIGHDIHQFNSNGSKLLDMGIYWKRNSLVIRSIIDISIRLATSLYNSNELQKDLAHVTLDFHGILQHLFSTDTSESFVGTTIGRLVSLSKVVGNYTKKLCFSVCRAIQRLHKYEEISYSQGKNEGERIHSWKLAIFWIEQLCKVDNWSTDLCCLFCINEICKMCMRLNIHHYLIRVLEKKDELKKFALVKPSFFSLLSQPFPSNLLSGNLFSKKVVKPVKEYPYLALLLLLGIGRSELNERQQVGYMILEKRKPFEQAAAKSLGADFSIFRILGYCLIYSTMLMGQSGGIDMEIHSCLPIFWQLFFCLYFESLKDSSGKMRFFGYYFLDISTRSALILEIIQTLERLSAFYKKIYQEEQMKIAKGVREEIMSPEHSKQLHELYYAMSIWSKESKDNFLQLISTIEAAPDHYVAERLVSAINENVFLDEKLLWSDLIDRQALETDAIGNQKYLASVYPNSNKAKSKTHGPTQAKVMNIDYVKNREKILMKPAPVIFTNETEKLKNLNLNEFNAILIGKCCSAYNDLITRHLQVDNEYISLLPSLYENVTKMARLTLSCYKGPFCKGSTLVQFTYKDKQQNSTVLSNIEANRKYAETLLRNENTNPLLISLLLNIENTISHLIENQISADGIQWFFLILSTWDKVIEQYPPIQRSFKSILNRLGETFIAQNPKETLNLLSVMLENTTRIKLLHKYFNPNICPDAWRQFFDTIYESKKSYGASIIYPLYTQHDIGKWLSGNPTKESKRDILSHCVMVFVDYYQFNRSKIQKDQEGKEHDADNKIFDFYMDVFYEILRKNFPELLLDTLEMIMSCVVKRSISPCVLQAMTTLPFEAIGNDRELLKDVLHLIPSYLWKMRRNNKSALYDCCNEYMESLIIMIKNIFLKQNSSTLSDVDFTFDLLCKSLEPWIFTVFSDWFYQQTHNTQKFIILPFNASMHSKQAAFVIQCFVDIVTQMQHVNPDILKHVWHLYTHILAPDLPNEHIALYHQVLVRLNWNYWKNGFQTEQLVKMQELIGYLDTVDRLGFLKHIIMEIEWKSVESQFVSASMNHSQLSAQFYAIFAMILTDLIIYSPLDAHEFEYFNNFIHKLLVHIDWTRMETKEYVALLQHCNKILFEPSKLSNSPIVNQYPSERMKLIFTVLEHTTGWNHLPDGMTIQETPLSDQHDTPLIASVSITNPVNLPLDHTYSLSEREEWVKCKLKQYIHFLNHIFSVSFQHHDNKQQSPDSYPSTALFKYLKSTRKSLFEWGIEVVVCLHQREMKHLVNDTGSQAKAITAIPYQYSNSTFELMIEILQVFNFSSPQFSKQAEIVFHAVSAHPDISPLVLQCSRAITSIEKLCSLTERCLVSYFEMSMSDWSFILQCITIPELEVSKQEFLKYSVTHYHPLSLHAYFLHRIYDQRENISAVESDLLALLSKMNRIDQGKEHYQYPLWILYLDIFSSKQASQKHEYQGPILFANMLLNYCGYNSSVFSKIANIFGRSSYSMEFNMTALCLACYLLSRTTSWGSDEQEYKKVYSYLSKQQSKMEKDDIHFQAIQTTFTYISNIQQYGSGIAGSIPLLRSLIHLYHAEKCRWLPRKENFI